VRAYVPLRWRTTLAARSLAVLMVSTVSLEGLQLAFGARTTDSKELGLLALTALALLGIAVGQIGAVVFVLLWIHRASRNLRGLGRIGMRETPGACVVSFFIPIGSLWMPVYSMMEIWRASDPRSTESSWRASEATPLLAVWWLCWLASIVIGAVVRVGHDEGFAGVWDLVAEVPRAVAAASLAVIVWRIDARQAQIARAVPA
jgi:hypothetical protein